MGMVAPVVKGRFRGAYSVGSALDARDHDLTPERDSIEEVVADLLDAQKQKRSLQFAQILDTMTLRPIEPTRATLARLAQPEAGGNGTRPARRALKRSKTRDHDADSTPRSLGALLLMMAVICLGTVVCVAILR